MTVTSSTYKIKNISIYDGMGRLKSEVESDITKAYTYDPDGNRAIMTVSGLDNYTTTYSYDRNNRLLTETKDSGDALATVTYAYDANGNQLSKVGGTLSTSIGNPVVVGLSVLGQSEDSGLIAEINTYNAFNQLTQVQTARHSVSYAYKADGLRTSKTSNGQTTSFVWDGSNIAAENRGGEYQTYTRGIGLIRNGAGEYYLFDAHGDVVQMAGNGGVVREYKYDAFGNEVEPDEDDTNPFRYCGEYWDGETGTVYLRNRYYSSSSGRFLTEDPIQDGFNWYTYASHNPVAFFDPLGLSIRPGDMVINGWSVGNTFPIDNKTYSSLRDFTNAVDGSISNRGNGVYAVKIANTSFNIDISSFSNNEMQRQKVTDSKTKKSYTIEYTKVPIGDGYSEIIIGMQEVVNMAKDRIKAMSYYVGTAGGTYSYSSALYIYSRSVVIPTADAKKIYNNTAFVDSFGDTMGQSLGEIGGTLVTGLIEQHVNNKLLESHMNSGKEFMIFTEQLSRFGQYDSWFVPTTTNNLPLHGTNVGTFLYGVYE